MLSPMETIVAILFVALAAAVTLLVLLWLLAAILSGLGAAFDILVTLVTGEPLDAHPGRRDNP